MIISINTGKAFDNNQDPYDKNKSLKVDIEGTYLNKSHI